MWVEVVIKKITMDIPKRLVELDPPIINCCKLNISIFYNTFDYKYITFWYCLLLFHIKENYIKIL